MQNSEAVQAWFQGNMARFRILSLVSKNEIRSWEFSFLSRSLRVKIINLDLVSMPEIGGNLFSVLSRSLRVIVRNSWSRLDERDWIGATLILVSRLKKTTLADHWFQAYSPAAIWTCSYFYQREMNNKDDDETNCDNRVQNNTRWTSVAVARLEEIDQLQHLRLVRWDADCLTQQVVERISALPATPAH